MVTSDSQYDHQSGYLENVISQPVCKVESSDVFIFVPIWTPDSQYGHHSGFLENVVYLNLLVRLDNQVCSDLYE